jgi:hypothetical protein
MLDLYRNQFYQFRKRLYEILALHKLSTRKAKCSKPKWVSRPSLEPKRLAKELTNES